MYVASKLDAYLLIYDSNGTQNLPIFILKLSSLLLKELKNAGITHKMDTPKPGKKQPAFSTPGGASSSAASAAGRVFGRSLGELSQLLVALDADTDILVPKFVVGACAFIQVEESEGFFAIFLLLGILCYWVPLSGITILCPS